MCLEEFSQLLNSDSPSIEFSTENGQVHGMKEQLKQAKDLLQAMIEAKDVPTIEVIHRLCDPANVLDDLELQEECLVVGDAHSVRQGAVSLHRALAVDGNEQHKRNLAEALHNYGITLHAMGHLEDAHNVRKEAVSLHRSLAVDGNEQHKRGLAEALHNYGITLHALGHFEDAHKVRQEAVSLYRALAADGNE